MNINESVILVDENDKQVGTMEKLEAHYKGLLHRAFSVFIFNTKGELLLQQRAFGKYHSAGLWSNTCCSHPFPGENTDEGAARRLKEEMGLICDIHPVFDFIYHANLENGLIEHEYDHVYFGMTDNEPVINKTEIHDVKYISMTALVEDLSNNHNKYTAWLSECIEIVMEHYDKEGMKTDIKILKR